MVDCVYRELTPGRYVGAEARRLDEAIWKSLEDLEYDE